MERSTCWVTARDGRRLVGFVHVAWDGGEHGFVLDTTVHPDLQRRGVGADRLRDRALGEFSPETVAAITGVDADTIARFAHRLAREPKSRSF